MHIFGFCKYYNKIVYDLKHSLTLVKKTDDDAIFRGAVANAGKVIVIALVEMYRFIIG